MIAQRWLRLGIKLSFFAVMSTALPTGIRRGFSKEWGSWVS